MRRRGQLCEMGGVFRLRVGAPAPPVLFITDEDIVISAPQELDPFPGLAASVNAIAAEYPEPASLWAARAAPPLFNPSWEAEDGGRRLSTSIGFPACPDLSQVAQLMAAYVRDARRFRTHRLVLGGRRARLRRLICARPWSEALPFADGSAALTRPEMGLSRE